MKRRWKILIIVSVALAVAFLISVIRHYQLRHAVESYIAELKAKGEPMELSQMLPPPVSPDRDGTKFLREAMALIDADKSLLTTNSVSAMKMIAPGKAMIRWHQSDVRDQYMTNSWDEVIGAVFQNQPALELLRPLIDHPTCDFQFDYSKGFGETPMTNLFLSEIKRAAQRLLAAVLCDLQRSDGNAAVKDGRSILALVKTMRDQRLIISELVRIAAANIAASSHWEILQATNLTDEQLATLQHGWESLDFVGSMKDALAMERAVGLITLAKQRRSNAELDRILEVGQKALEVIGASEKKETFLSTMNLKVKFFLWRYWWSYPDELRGLRVMIYR